RHVDEDQAGEDYVERPSRQLGGLRVSLHDLHVRQVPLRNELPRRRDVLVALFESDDGPLWPHPLGKQIEHALWTAAQIDRLVTLPNVELIKQPARFPSELLRLLAQTFFFALATSEQIDVRSRHGSPPSKLAEPRSDE